MIHRETNQWHILPTKLYGSGGWAGDVTSMSKAHAFAALLFVVCAIETSKEG